MQIAFTNFFLNCISFFFFFHFVTGALLLAETHGLLVGPSTGAAVRAAIVIGQRMSMKNKNIVVIAPSSGVRYLQHPMFRSLRKQAFDALSEEDAGSNSKNTGNTMTYPSAETILQTRVAAEKKAKTQAENRLELVQRVQECVLGLVRTLLETPDLKPNDNLIDHGATSLTAMLLLGKSKAKTFFSTFVNYIRNFFFLTYFIFTLTLYNTKMNIGKLRTSLEGVLEGTEIYGLRLAIIKERLWGCTRDLALGVVGVDENGNEHPMDDSIDAKVTIEYCGKGFF